MKTNKFDLLSAVLLFMALAFGLTAQATTKTVTYTMGYSMQLGSNYFLSLEMSGDTPFDGTTTIPSEIFSGRTSANFELADGFTFFFNWDSATTLQSSALGFCHSDVNLQYTVRWSFLGVTNGNNYYVTNVQLTDVNGHPMNLEGGGTATTDFNYSEQQLSLTYTAAKGPANSASTGFFYKLVITYTDAPGLSIFNQLNDGSYRIQNRFDLRHLADYVNRGQNTCSGLTFRQTNNISCDNTCTPIGHKVGNYNQNCFNGTYDGGGFTISNMNYSSNSSGFAGQDIGLFGYIEYGTVRNVVIANSSFTGFLNVGAIAGNNNRGTIQNCRVESDVTIKAGTTNAKRLGGIAGNITGTNAEIAGCICAASVTRDSWTGTESFGGIVGYSYSGTIKDCLYTGSTINVNEHKGAIVGYGQSGSFSNNYYTNNNHKGMNGSDVDGARRARTVTLGEGVNIVGAPTVYSVSNLTAIGTGNYAMRLGSNPIFSGATQTLNLSYNGTVPTGYSMTYTATPGNVSGNTLTMPDANVSVSTSFVPTDYVITYNLNGGNVATANPTTYNIETPSFTLNNPTRTGYTFAGWTGTDLNGATQTVTIAQGSTGERSYTATWTPITYSITYDLDGGSVATANPTTYNIETETFTLNNPTRSGYAFAGWTGTDLTAVTQTVTIAQGSTGARSYTATWTFNCWQGSGTEDNPYLISTTADLDLLATEVNSGSSFSGVFFSQTANIVYDGTENNYRPIGTFNNSLYFSGTYNGNGFYISGININRSGTNVNDISCIGIFGHIKDANIRNVILKNSTMIGHSIIGGIVGFSNNNSNISNCRVESSVTIGSRFGTGQSLGGIAGINGDGTISGCYSAAVVTNNDHNNCIYYGGIVGGSAGIVKDCLYTGTSVTASSNYGSIAGDNSVGIITNNYYTADGPGGSNGSDCDGARRARTLTLGENIVLVGDETAYNISGLTAIGTGNYALRHGSTIYSGATQNVTLSYTGSVPEGYMVTYSYNDGTDHVVVGNSFTMPAADVIVNATMSGTLNNNDLVNACISGVNVIYMWNNGNAIDINYTVTDYNGNVLTEGTDYTVAITNSMGDPVSQVTDPGNYTLTITGTGSYTGSKFIDFIVTDHPSGLSVDYQTSGYYINLPKNRQTVIDLSSMTPAFTTPFKVYDDGGKNRNFTQGCSEDLIVVAPEGYVLQVCGTIDIGDETLLEFYDGTWGENLMAGNFNRCLGDDIGFLITTGPQLAIKYNTSTVTSRWGLSLTVIPVAANTVSPINIIDDGNGSVTAKVNDATVIEATVNDLVTLTATPNAGYLLNGFSAMDDLGNNIPVEGGWYTGNNLTLKMAGSDVTISPYFVSSAITNVDDIALSVNMPRYSSDPTDAMVVTIPDEVECFKIYDNGGAEGNYSYSSDGYLLLVAPENKVIQLTASSMHDIWSSDYLEVFDGNNTDHPLGGPYSYDDNLGVLTSTGNQMLLHFVCNGTNYSTNKGLDLLARVYDTSTEFAITVTPTEYGTVAIEPASNASVSSTVTLTFTANEGYTDYRAMVFTTNYPSVPVEGGWYSNNVMTFTMPAGPVTVTPNYTKATTAEDGLYVNMPKKNTYATSRMVNIPVGISSFKVYDDGGYDGIYSDFCDGYMILTAAEGRRIRLTGTVDCAPDLDFLEVYDGNTTEQLLGSYSDESYTIGTIYSSGQSMLLHFYSNNLNQPALFEGLNLTVEAINSPSQVQITVKGYGNSTASEKWVFLALPAIPEGGSVNPTTITGLTTINASHYDLYRFNQSAAAEWENFKNGSSNGFTTMRHGRGYLYANKNTVTLTFSGTFLATETHPVALAYDANAEFKGCNLVGNPFSVAAYADRPYYKMNAAGTEVEPVDSYWTNPIPVCTGVVVVADGTGQQVTFSKTAPNAPTTATGNNGSLQLTLTLANTRSHAVQDKAIVSFAEGIELGKYIFNDEHAKLYIPHDGKDYAIAVADSQGEMPVNFKARENGEYTISVNPENVEMGYLHLIDNLTGANIDLLATPSYTFTARNDDYASRFKLVFGNENNNENEDFAFISNGEIIVNGEGVVQVIDVLGRVIVCRDAMHCVSTAGMTPGVYVLRLINGQIVKTQKIVIK